MVVIVAYQIQFALKHSRTLENENKAFMQL